MTKGDQSARQIILPPTAGTGAEELTEKQKLQAVSLWQEEQLRMLSQPAKRKHLEMATYLPPTESWREVTYLLTPNYQPDRAMRAAILAPEEWRRWKTNEAVYWAYRYPMNSGNDLHVFLGGARPPDLEEARQIVESFRLSMVLTARICLSIWLTRRHEERLTQTGSALINLDEILAIRGMKKARTVIYHGEHNDISYSNGYRWEDKKAILDDLILLQQCYVQGECTVNIDGQWANLGIDDQYLHFSLLTRKNQMGGKEEKIGVFVTAGNWIHIYETHNNIYIAEAERELFKFNPQQDIHELMIGLYLAERWRDLARKQEYEKPILLQHLLEESKIRIDRRHSGRFMKRIEEALKHLYERNIIGSQSNWYPSINRNASRIMGTWLATPLVLLPPKSIIDYYNETIVKAPVIIPAPATPKRRSGSKRK